MRGQFDTREARQWTTGTVWKMQPQLRNARNHQKLKEARNRFLETLRSVALSISWVWPNDTVSSSGLQSCERINFCGFSHWLYDNLLQQAQETNALPTGQGELVSLLLTNATSGLAFVRLPHGGAAPRTAGEASQQQASSPAFRSVLRHISTYLHASMYVYSYMHAHTHRERANNSFLQEHGLLYLGQPPPCLAQPAHKHLRECLLFLPLLSGRQFPVLRRGKKEGPARGSPFQSAGATKHSRVSSHWGRHF